MGFGKEWKGEGVSEGVEKDGKGQLTEATNLEVHSGNERVTREIRWEGERARRVVFGSLILKWYLFTKLCS